MLRKHITSEKGQTVVLLALAFIVLLGFTALAIDGGMVYANRRHMQSASDAASLAGGSAVAMYLENHYVVYNDWDCSDPRVIKAQINGTNGGEITAIKSASVNDYTIDADISDMNGVDTDCIQGYDNGSWIERYIDVKTFITSDTPTAFAHFVYNGPLRNTVEAVTRVKPRIPLAFGNAIVALGMDCQDSGIEFDGSSGVSVTGGGIFSNSCIDTQGGVGVTVYGGHDITCRTPNCYDDHGGAGTVNPHPEEGMGRALPRESYAVQEPQCSSMPDRGEYNNDGTLEPGRYSRIRIQNGDHIFEPGLYCVSGEVTINGGTAVGTNITLYLTAGDFNSSGNATINFTAPPVRNCGAPCETHNGLPGLLIYLAEGNTGEVALLGNEDSNYLGLVYAPDGTIQAGGTSSTMAEIHAQLIAYDVKVHGNTAVTINFDDGLNYQIPASLDLNK
ncbi:MAG: Tad domain-containing protein [Chloroflexota bacterium]|nr:MAG: Tad domain-containing protein [Chloroflexota bacterium]UCF28355.1 MAG: Tad domain-containing protein [Chloroflexota bacterium]